MAEFWSVGLRTNSPSPLKPIELAKIGPESNGPSERCKQLKKLSQKGSIFEKLTLFDTLFKLFLSRPMSVGLRTNLAQFYGFQRTGANCSGVKRANFRP